MAPCCLVAYFYNIVIRINFHRRVKLSYKFLNKLQALR
jgi:hypothetical protein